MFFHVFILWGLTNLYNKYVIALSNFEYLKTQMQEYEEAGLNGYFGSMDATHAQMEMCYQVLKNHHIGGKEKQPCQTYNIIVNHC